MSVYYVVKWVFWELYCNNIYCNHKCDIDYEGRVDFFFHFNELWCKYVHLCEDITKLVVLHYYYVSITQLCAEYMRIYARW